MANCLQFYVQYNVHSFFFRSLKLPLEILIQTTCGGVQVRTIELYFNGFTMLMSITHTLYVRGTSSQQPYFKVRLFIRSLWILQHVEARAIATPPLKGMLAYCSFTLAFCQAAHPYVPICTHGCKRATARTKCLQYKKYG